MLGTAVLWALGSLMPLRIAEKILLTLIVLGFVSGFTMLARLRREGRTPAVALVAPALVFGWPLFMGFYSFLLGLCCVVWGWWASARGRFALLAGLGVIAWLAHPLAVILVLLGGGILGGREGLRDRRRWAAIGPALALTALYALGFEGAESQRWGLGKLLETTLTLRAAAAYEGAQEWTALAIAAVLAAIAVFALRGDRARDFRRWLALAGGCLVLVLALPDGSSGHWFLSERLSLAPWLALVPLCAVATHRMAAIGGLTVLTAAHLALSVGPTLDAGRELGALQEVASPMSAGASFLTLDLDGAPAGSRVRPFLQGAAWTGVARSAISMGNYEAQTDHFQTRLKKHIAMPAHERLMKDPPEWDLVRFHGRIGWLVVIGTKGLDRLRVRIAHRYREVRHNGRFRLFERVL